MVTNLSPNFWPNRQTPDFPGVVGAPRIIVLHMTEGSFVSARGWLCNPASDASATVLIGKDGTVLPLVRDEDAPWTNGFQKGQTVPPTNPWVLDSCWNNDNPPGRHSPSLWSLTAEIEWFARDGVIAVGSPVYLAVVRWVAEKCIRWDIPATRIRIMGHYEISPKEKPLCGTHIPWPYLIADVQKLVAAHVNPDAPSDWAADGWALAKKLGITDGTRPKETATREEIAHMILRATGKLKKT